MNTNETPESAAAAVPLDDIRLDGDARNTQLREALDDDVVNQYAEAMKRGDVFPLVDLVETGDGTYFIADGWHRVKALRKLGKSVVLAVTHSVPEGGEPLDVAVKLALKANSKHGLHLTRGDQRKKARAALLHSDYQGWSLRALEVETGVGKSTLGRVRTQLIREGELVHPVLGSEMPEWVPESHASVFVLNSQFADGDEMERVYGYVKQLAPQGDPKDWEWDAESGEVVHGGLIAGKKVAFGISSNLVVNGIPSKWEEVVEEDDEEDGGELAGWSWKNLTQEERDRIEAARARREFHKATKRIKDRGDKELNRAVNTLMKRSDEPGLWGDLKTLLASGGPAADHGEEEF